MRLLHPLLTYRMLGSVAEAEDVVQEALLRLHRALQAGEEPIESPRAYLTTVAARLAPAALHAGTQGALRGRVAA